MLPHVQRAAAHVSRSLKASLICVASWPWKRSLINATRTTKSKRIGSCTDGSRKCDTALHTSHFRQFRAAYKGFHWKRSRYTCFGRAGIRPQAIQSENVKQEQDVNSGICTTRSSKTRADMPHTYCWGAAWDAAGGRTRTHVKASVCLQQQSHTCTETNTVTNYFVFQRDNMGGNVRIFKMYSFFRGYMDPWAGLDVVANIKICLFLELNHERSSHSQTFMKL